MQPITLTNAAKSQIESLLSQAPEGTQGLRLTVKQTGCSGNSYKMEYIKPSEVLAADDAFGEGAAKLYIPKMHSWMLFGLTVDYVMDDLGNAKFDFINPNEKGRCGCGESFQA